MDPVRIYDYLTLARQRVLDAVAGLSPQEYVRQLPFGMKTLGCTLAHTMIAEWYYIERLQGRPVPPYSQWPVNYEQPPPFDEIRRTWEQQATNIRAAVAAEKDWSRDISWLSFPDDTRGNKRFQIACTAGDLFTQLALHEVHHRAQIMAMLRELGKPVQDIDYNDLMYERREVNA